MAKKIRKKTLSLDSYLEKIVEEDISVDQHIIICHFQKNK